MFRISHTFAAALLLLSASCLTAQHDFPDANWTLNDLKHEVTAPPPPAEGKYTQVGDRQFVRIDPTPTRIGAIQFSRDGKFLAAAKDYGRIVIWDVEKKQVYCVIEAGTNTAGEANRVAISPDDEYVTAWIMGKAEITVWHLPDGKQVNSFSHGKMASVESISFIHDSATLIYAYTSSTSSTMPDGRAVTSLRPVIDIANPLTGAQVASWPGEKWPVLSADGSTLMTESGMDLILRNTSDWTEQKRLPRLTDYADPIFLDLARGWYLFWDDTDDHRFVVAQISDGKMAQSVRLANLPKFHFRVQPLAAVEPRSGLVYGHGGERLWAWDPKNGDTCFSPEEYSDVAALSPDGKLVASAFDSPTVTNDQNNAGVAIWKTKSVAKRCHLK